MKSLAKNSVFNLVYTILNMIFPLISSAYAARILLADGIGRVTYAQSIANYFVLFAMLGIQNYGMREISVFREDKNQKNRLFTQIISFNAITTTVSLIAYICLIWNFTQIRDDIQLYVACGMAVFWNYLNIDWLYQGEEEYSYIVCRSVLIKIISILALFALVKKQDDYILYAWITSAAMGANFIFNMLHAQKYVSFDFTNFQLVRHAKPIFIFALGILASNIYAQADITMIGIMKSKESVGYYYYGQRIINLIISLETGITSVYLPRLCYLYSNEKQEFQKLLETGTRILFFLSIPMAVGVYLLAPQIVEVLFGTEFKRSAIIVRFFCPMILIRGFGDLLCYQLSICTENERIRIPSAILASLGNVIVNLILIPYFAEFGAVIASIIAEIIVFAYQFLRLRKTVEFGIPTDAIWQSLLSSVVMTVGVLAVKPYFAGAQINMVVSIAVAVCLYVFINHIMHNRIEVMFFNAVSERIKKLKKSEL